MSRYKIAVVEDERLVAMALEERLHRMGYVTVANVASGEDAIEACDRERPDLVLMDIQLAGNLDGVETASIVRERFGIPSVFLTAYSDSATLERAKITEPFGYLVKPFDARLLEVTLEVALYREKVERERARVETRLRESEARYRNLTRVAPVGIFHADTAGAYRYVNERWCSLTGLSLSEAVGDGWERVLLPEERAGVVGRWREVVAAGRPLSQELTVCRPDGSTRRVYLRAEPERTESGEIVAYVGTLVDLTELHEAQEEARARERQLEAATRNLPILLAQVDRDLRYRMAKGDYGSWWGMAEQSVVGQHVRDVVGPELYPEVEPHLRRVLDGERVEFELEVPTRNGRRWMREVLVPEKRKTGEVQGYFSLVLDVTSNKREAQARQHTERRYGAILDNSPDAIVSVDAETHIVVFNKGAERAFGYKAEEVLGKPLEMLVPAEQRFVHRSHVAAFRQETYAWSSMSERPEIYGQRKSGEVFPAEAVIGRIEQGGETLMTAILRDVTDRRRLEQQYLQAQKMEALGRLAGGIAHDFNNVLSSLMGQVDLMRLGLSRTDPLQADLEEVLADCERAAALTRHLLVFSRQQMLEPRVVEARGVVAGLEKMLRRLLREDIVFELDVEGSTSSVRIDPGQLEQIVLNLSVNARDAMPNGGELHIRLRDLVLEEQDASSEPDVAPGRYVALEVSDSGSGMTPEVASRIFEPFFSTKEVGKGTGLGLSTVFGIVGRAKGHVKVDTEPGRGSRFTVLLPRVEPETPSVGEAPAETEGGNETILLVEDDDHVRRSTKAILERSGYNVLSARSGSEALSLARDRAASIDLLVSDVIMPRMGGRELAGRLRETRPKLKTIFISGYAGEEAPDDAPVFDALLLKPFSARSLTDRVRQVLDARDEPLSAGVGQS